MRPRPCSDDLYRALVAGLPAARLDPRAEREACEQILAIGSSTGTRTVAGSRGCEAGATILDARSNGNATTGRHQISNCRGEDRWVVSDSWLDADYWIARPLDERGRRRSWSGSWRRGRGSWHRPSWSSPAGCRMSLSRFEGRWPLRWGTSRPWRSGRTTRRGDRRRGPRDVPGDPARLRIPEGPIVVRPGPSL